MTFSKGTEKFRLREQIAGVEKQQFFRRFGYALTGLKISWQSERSFRTHIVGAVFVLIILVATRPAPAWWAFLFSLLL